MAAQRCRTKLLLCLVLYCSSVFAFHYSSSSSGQTLRVKTRRAAQSCMVPRLDARRAHAHDADILLHDEATEPESPVATEIDTDLILHEHESLLPSSTFSIVLNGLLDALGLSTRWVVAGSVAAALLLNRDADTLAFVSGSIANGALSKVLKVCTV
jgi:hypothetical protein